MLPSVGQAAVMIEMHLPVQYHRIVVAVPIANATRKKLAIWEVAWQQ